MKNLILILSVLLSSSAFAQGPPTIIYGTTGNDVMRFQGSLQQLTIAITNAYSGEVVFLDDVSNTTSYAYDGLAGTDTMALTNQKDAAFLQNTNGYQMIYNIERFIFSDGDDIAELASTNFVLGNVFIDGGRGNDILWANWGNDTIRGGDGNDRIDGGPGSDILDGQNDDDIISGGDGNDIITPGSGVDALFGNDDHDSFFFTGDGTNANGLNISLDTLDGGPGFDTIYLTSGSDYLSLRDTNGNQVIFDIEQFNLGNGNDVLDLSDASIVLSNLTIYGEAGNDLIIANAGDDYIDAGNSNDVVQGGMGNDYIFGGDGSDILDGGPGNDTIRAGAGADQAWGGDGDDTFIATAPEAANDELDGGDGADTLDVSEILTGFNPATSDPDRFVQIVPLTVGEFEFEVRVNTDGDLGGAFTPIARIRSIEFLELSPGSLIVIPRIPEIVVEQPVSTDIVNGGTNSFGTVAAGSNTNLTFTIRNLGAGELDLTGTPKVQMSGANAADFTVTLQPMTPVAFNHTTAFEVSFAPSATGLRTALITIVNNDTNENPFEITLTGTGVCPVITLNPPTLPDGVVGSNYSQTITASGGVAPYNYGVTSGALPGGLDLTGAGDLTGTATNIGMFNFTVTATDTNGCTGEQIYALTVLGTPQISSQPQSRTNVVGTLADFAVTASGTTPLTYQWWKDAALLSGETNDTYSIAGVTANDAADYFVVVTNVAGSVTSMVATLTVWVPPTITNDPVSSTNLAGSTVMFSATAEGMEPLTYRWLKDGAALFDGGNAWGADTTMLTLTNLGLSDAADYSVWVTNVAGSVTSQVAVLTVVAPPEIASQPQSATNYVGDMVLLSVTADGTEPLRYQWWQDTAPLSGETNDTFSIASADLTNAGDYVVVVTNNYGSVTSEVATLTVVVSNSPGIDIVWTNTFGGSWHVAANWSPNLVPRPQDSATIGLAVIVSVNSAATVSNLTFSSATLSGNGVLSIGGVMALESGKLSGKLVIAPEGILNVTNNTIVFLDGCSLTNYGTVTWAGTDHLYVGNNAAVHNEGLWEIQTDNDIIYWSGVLPSFSNTGTFRKTGGSGDTSINIGFNTTGQVDVQQGTLSIYAWLGDSTLHGTLLGSVSMSPGPSLTVASNAIWNWSGGTVSGAVAIASNGVCNWLDGTLGGNLDVASGGALNLTNSTIVFMDGGTLTNRGAVLWTGDMFYVGNSAAIYNEGLWEIQTDSDIVYWSGLRPNLVNVGTLSKTSSGGITAVGASFTTTGTMDIQTGWLDIRNWTGTSTVHGTLNWIGDLDTALIVAADGTLNLGNDANYSLTQCAWTNFGTVRWDECTIHTYADSVIYNAGLWLATYDNALRSDSDSTNDFINAGMFRKTDGFEASIVDWNFTNHGTNEVLSGALWLKGAAVQVGGLTFVGGGELYLDEAFELNGGWMLGTNAILGDVINDGGTVGPGASPGLLSIDGDYVQTAAGTLAIELAGYAAGTNFDRLAVGGSAQLDGTLSVTVTDGFAPTNNSTFTFLTAGSRSGTFATFHHPSNTFGMEAGYTANSALVVITNVVSVVPVLTEPPFLDSGDIVARFSGMPGESYTIEWTPGLSPANWQKAVNLTAPATDLGLGVGVFEFREAVVPGGQRFYRAVHPAY